MSVTNEDLEFVRSKLAVIGPIEIKKMFGAAAIYYEGRIFGMIDDGDFYVKVDDENVDEFTSRELKQASYPQKDGTIMTMGYYAAPKDWHKSEESILFWTQLGIDASLRKQQSPKKSSKKKST